MSLILNIDTSTEIAHVSVSQEGIVLKLLQNGSQKDHASFLQPAIQQLIKEAGLSINDMFAVAVTGGPGSYTGLRVGMASAKGLCYALKIPLIVHNTLEILAASAIYQSSPGPLSLFCPMIDARRMEVFTAVFGPDLETITSPVAMILEDSSFEELLSKNKVLFFGSGSKKWKDICRDQNALFESISIIPSVMAKYSDTFFNQRQFADLANCEPFYLKDFQSVIRTK